MYPTIEVMIFYIFVFYVSRIFFTMPYHGYRISK